VRIREIIWLPEIVEKIERKHQVLQYEVRVDDMAKNKRKAMQVPANMSILEASDFWDEHSLLDFPNTQEETEIDIHIEREQYYCPVSKRLMEKLQVRAQEEGVSTETLVNLYLQEKLA
jgi:CopG antitoxin of type II toxin-antitoxin system